uniref:Putative hydroxypyruvate isomerase n=1 Tax=Homalodisca liturata TaxID=320908 RepID=A0A1B6I7L9_9HEMI
MLLKFCPNLSFMFQETSSILERYSLARQSGFQAVEGGFVYSTPIEVVVKAKREAGVQQILLNVNPGDANKGELGFAAIPGQQEKFKNGLQEAITYCKALDCRLVHIMSGKVQNPNDENDKVYEENLRLAASILQEENMVGIIEPINGISLPGYYMNNFRKGLDVVKKVNSPHIRLMADLFHFQMMKLDLSSSIKEAFPYIGHVQVAQAPNRNEPDTQGEIDFKSTFSLLESLGYDGWIGLEYKPASDTNTGLKWIQAMGYTL